MESSKSLDVGKKCAIIGSRPYKNAYNIIVWRPTLQMVRDAVLQSGFDFRVVVSGEAQGVDTLAKEYSEEAQKYYIGIPVPQWGWNYKPKYAPHERNKIIVDVADMLVAVRHNHSQGTTSAILFAQEKGIPYYVLDIPYGG